MLQLLRRALQLVAAVLDNMMSTTLLKEGVLIQLLVRKGSNQAGKGLESAMGIHQLDNYQIVREYL
jgi:hypothetical protein